MNPNINKCGRPPFGETKRTLLLRTRVNKHEHSIIAARANLRGVTVAEYLREVALFYEVEPREYRPGSLPPATYLAWHEWAKVQDAAGLKQTRCPRCGKYRYPQQPCRRLQECPE